MKTKQILIAAALAILLCISISVMAEEGPWFDMANCGFCKHLLEQPDFLDHTTWEHYNITNGLVTVSTVDREYLDAYHKVSQAMKETSEKMQKGEAVHMCGMCTAMGALLQKGVTMDYVETERGNITVMTSDNPELVKEIQAWGQRNKDEMAEMMMDEGKGEK